MKTACSEFQSAAEVVTLNCFKHVALNIEKVQDLQRRRLAFLHSWDYLSLFPLFPASHLPCLSFFRRAQASFEMPQGEMRMVV